MTIYLLLFSTGHIFQKLIEIKILLATYINNTIKIKILKNINSHKIIQSKKPSHSFSLQVYF